MPELRHQALAARGDAAGTPVEVDQAAMRDGVMKSVCDFFRMWLEAIAALDRC